MEPATENNQDLDLKLLSGFIYELNIARRYAISYPPEHPIIINAAGKVIKKLELLLETHPSVTLGIARSILLFNSGVLDRKNPVYSDFAGYLFARGIAIISFSRQVTAEEMICLFQTLGHNADIFRARGNAVQQLSQAGIENIKIQEIDYSSFRVTEEDEIAVPGKNILEHEAEALWSRFVEGVMQGNLDAFGKGITSTEQIDPERLAAFLNQRSSKQAITTDSSYGTAIASFMRQLDRDNLASRYDADSIKKLGEFVKNLSPELRRQFLQSTFDSLQSGDTVKKLLSQFPDDVILDALHDVNEKKSNLSQGIVNLLQIIAKTGTETTRSKKSRAIPTLTHDELSLKLKDIFREDDPERFITDSYRTTLKSIASIERFTVLAPEELATITEQVNSSQIEPIISDIILHIMETELESEDVQVLQENLMDLVEVFLNTGDYRALAKIHLQIRQKYHGGAFGILPIHETVYARFMEPEFLDEILNGLAVWGKTKYEEIMAIIVGVGDPFVEQLIHRLTIEPNMSLRHYYMECLYNIGDAAKEAAILNLADSRWYVVRNMVILLRRFGDPTSLRHLRKIATHSHPKVRQEVIRTLFTCRHPEADNLLQKEFKSLNHEIVLAAIQLAEQSRNPVTFECLRRILNIKLLAAAEYELKKAAVNTLGKIANPAILPDLEKILGQKSLFATALLKKLKEDIVASLKHYPHASVMPLLERVRQSDARELSHMAAILQKKLEGNAS